MASSRTSTLVAATSALAPYLSFLGQDYDIQTVASPLF